MGNEEDGVGVNKPVRIHEHLEPPSMTADEMIKYQTARHQRRIQTGFLLFLGVVALGFLTPLIVFLTRIAAGG